MLRSTAASTLSDVLVHAADLTGLMATVKRGSFKKTDHNGATAREFSSAKFDARKKTRVWWVVAQRGESEKTKDFSTPQRLEGESGDGFVFWSNRHVENLLACSHPVPGVGQGHKVVTTWVLHKSAQFFGPGELMRAFSPSGARLNHASPTPTHCQKLQKSAESSHRSDAWRIWCSKAR